MQKTNLSKIILPVLILALALSGCNRPSGEEQATPGMTQVYQTVEAKLTQAAALTPQAPSATPAPSNTPAPSPTTGAAAPSATQRPAQAQPTVVAKQCDMAAPGVPIDVTIPDGTKMTPGQTFTKTWRLVNTGTCTWTKDYSLALFSGDPMGASAGIQLKNEVGPGQSIDVSADLVAPGSSGTYRGNWKLRNAQGSWFGIGPSGASPFWVEITVGGTPSAPTNTGTPGTPYPVTVTPGSVSSGNVSMALNDTVNLDNGAVNAPSSDLLFKKNQSDKFILTPQSGATIAVMEFSQPSRETCAASGLGSSQITVTNLGSGQFVCFKTDKGRIGWMKMVSLDEATGTLIFQFQTWLDQ
jgi:hypothetical protein